MTTGLSTTVANRFLDHLTRNVTWTAIAAFYVKLHTGDPGASGASNAASNTTRQQATFGAASSGSCLNSADVNWTSVSAAESYSHVSFWDASTAGNFLGSNALTTTRGVAAGDNFTISSGQLSITTTPIAA